MDGDSKLLAEPPLLVLPSLAVAVGLNEAIVLQQLHFRGRATADGWWRARLNDLRREFPFWSEPTIKRALTRLRQDRLVEVRQDGTDRANRYRIDYLALRRKVGQIDPVERIGSSSIRSGAAGQADPIPIGSKRKGKREEGTAPDDYDAVVRR